MGRRASRILATRREVAALALLLLSVACTQSPDLPTAPTDRTTPRPTPDPTPDPVLAFPPLAGPGLVYGYLESLVGWGIPASGTRYVLYDDGTFDVQWPHAGGVLTPREARLPRRRYQAQQDGTILFQFDADRWATGTLSGDTLQVRYNPLMELEDAQDAAYLLDRSVGPKATDGAGTLRVTTHTLGAASYGPHALVFEIGEFEYPLAPDGLTELRLNAGRYWPQPYPAANCRSEGTVGPVEVYADWTTDLDLAFSCDPVGTARVALQVLGEDRPSSLVFTLARLDATKEIDLRVGRDSDMVQMLTTGDWSIEPKWDLPPNCTTDDTWPSTFTVAEGAQVDLAFSLSCVRYLGTVAVSVAVTGTPKGSFAVAHGGGGNECLTILDWCTFYRLGATVIWDLSPGTYPFEIVLTAPECAAMPPTQIDAVVTTADTTRLVFGARCPP